MQGGFSPALVGGLPAVVASADTQPAQKRDKPMESVYAEPFEPYDDEEEPCQDCLAPVGMPCIPSCSNGMSPYERPY